MESTHTSDSCRNQARPAGEFFNKLTSAALADLNSLLFPSSYAANVVLFSEKDPVQGIFVVTEGEVKVSLNSSEGRRLSLRIARKGGGRCQALFALCKDLNQRASR